MMSAPTIVLDRVTKVYGTSTAKVTAVDDVSLEVASGEFVSIMGSSGSGKSTLLSLIAGLDTPTSGRVFIGGEDLAQMADELRSRLRLQNVGFVFQSFNLFASFTVEENVGWPLEFLGRSWRDARDRASEILEKVGIAARARSRRPSELSGGEQQRVAIARALVTEPHVLLADEPTGNLDSLTGQAILDLLRELNADRRLTVMLVTHSAFAATYGHRTIELRDGRIVHEASAGRQAAGATVVPLRS